MQSLLFSVRKKYIDLLNTNPRAAISPYDYEISQKCDQLLNSEPTLSDLKGSVGKDIQMSNIIKVHINTNFFLFTRYSIENHVIVLLSGPVEDLEVSDQIHTIMKFILTFVYCLNHICKRLRIYQA